jgi:hypothetical protein
VLSDVTAGQESARLEGLGQGSGNEPFTFSADGALVAGVFVEET